jgi:pimeloyl-ACP methyl ester carboxylesterase
MLGNQGRVLVGRPAAFDRVRSAAMQLGTFCLELRLVCNRADQGVPECIPGAQTEALPVNELGVDQFVHGWFDTELAATGPISRFLTKKVPTLAALVNAPQLPIVVGFLDSISQFDGTAAYRALSRTPTLIMCGTVDRVTPPHHSAAIAAAVSAAEFVDVPGAGHMLMRDRPEVVNDRLDALLERVRRELAPRPPTPAVRAVPATAPLPLPA